MAARLQTTGEQIRLLIAPTTRWARRWRQADGRLCTRFANMDRDSPWEWAPALGGNLWRTTGDISAKLEQRLPDHEEQAGMAKYAGPGTGTI